MLTIIVERGASQRYPGLSSIGQAIEFGLKLSHGRAVIQKEGGRQDEEFS